MSATALRVALVCPYSVSVHGGVQGQVLGLAHALRDLGVDARVIAPSDGPPPEPGITSVGPTARFPTNGSLAPIASSSAVAARTIEALRTFTPDVAHLHEPFAPGPNHAVLLASDVPCVGTFHAAHPGRNAWYQALRAPLRPLLERLAVRTAVSREAQRNVEATFGGSCEILPNGVAHATLNLVESGPLDDTPVYRVPPGHYFMMGDNRDDSNDSRVLSEVGYVPEDNIIGRAEVTFFSVRTGRAWEFWRWPWTIRWDRLFSPVR